MKFIQKSFFSYATFVVIFLLVAVGTSIITTTIFNAINLKKQFVAFISVGPRFTALDGQELCLRIKDLETFSYGFKNAGKNALDCSYLHKKKLP